MFAEHEKLGFNELPKYHLVSKIIPVTSLKQIYCTYYIFCALTETPKPSLVDMALATKEGTQGKSKKTLGQSTQRGHCFETRRT